MNPFSLATWNSLYPAKVGQTFQVHTRKSVPTALQELLRQLTRGAELGLPRGERLLRLGVKRGVVNEGVDKDPQVVLDVEVLHTGGLDLLLLAVLDPVHHVVHHLVGDVVHMGAALGRADAVHKADLRVSKDRCQNTDYVF